MAAPTPTCVASCPRHDGYVPSCPVRCIFTHLVSKARTNTIARYMRVSSAASWAKAGSAATALPRWSRICRYWILKSATVRMRELCQAAAISGTVLTGQVLLSLHFDQTARGARKFRTQRLTVIQLAGRGRRRHHNVHIAIVEFIDQHDEAARGIVVAACKFGDIRYEHRVIEARDLDVIVLTSRPVADVLEFEPDH